MEFCLEKPLSCCFGGVSLTTHQLQQDYDEEEEDVCASLLSLFYTEEDHMPSAKYLKSLKDGEFVDSIRRDSISSISQSSSDFDPVLSYLAVNYLDRFLSSQRLKRAKPWVSRLVAVSCLSLAAKMLGAELPLSVIQSDGGSVNDSWTIHRMEVLILGALGWRMRSVTPFSFLPFFTSLFELKGVPSRQALRARAIEIILKAQNDAELLKFKPSLVAASALLSASYELFPIQFHHFRTKICECSYINEEELIEGYSATQKVATERYESVADDISGSDTPQNVLDQQFSTASSLSSADDEVLRSGIERTPKRRKIDGLSAVESEQKMN